VEKKMGGRSVPSSSNSSSNAGSGGHSGGAGDRAECPPSLRASVTGPTDDIVEGSWLLVTLDKSADPIKAVLVDPVSGNIVGSLAGVPKLAILIRCLDEGVDYRAYVDKIDGGRVDVSLARQ
jgi:hypothetical protein